MLNRKIYCKYLYKCIKISRSRDVFDDTIKLNKPKSNPALNYKCIY